jgi:hypothetical protein
MPAEEVANEEEEEEARMATPVTSVMAKLWRLIT